ncbi:putative galacturonosyltransferase 14 [Hordeum vulgare]|nr:putative galacturonosyltransferase 14 [Hordeum vulgare]
MSIDNAAAPAPRVFDEMGASCSNNFHDASAKFVHVLDDNTADIDRAPIGDYDCNEMDDGEHGHGEEENEVEEVEKGVFDQEQAKARTRSKNYTHLEDQILIKASESVSLDASTSTDQTANQYWQWIEDQFFRMMVLHDKIKKVIGLNRGDWADNLTISPMCLV